MNSPSSSPSPWQGEGRGGGRAKREERQRPPPRIEDGRFLAGAGTFVDDVDPPDAAHGAVLRSPHAHARILSIDAASALAAPGVLAVHTSADLAAAGLGAIETRTALNNRDGTPLAKPARPILADGRARFVGDAVAFVVAESAAAARDAMESIEVAYEPLPAVVEPRAALEPGAPLVREEVEGNLCLDYEAGDPEAVDAAFAAAAHIARVEILNQRVAVVPLEPRGAIGEYDSATGSFTLTASTQNVHVLRDQLAAEIFDVPAGTVRVRAVDVGGGFGAKNALYPEYPLVLFAARELGRPVKWIADRSESFLSDNDGRDQWSEVSLALDEGCRFLALRVLSVGEAGAYLAANGAGIATAATVRTVGGHYRIGARHFRSKVAFTHTSPTDPYRGAGRPEAAYQIERVIDAAARELAVDRVELRRLNVLRPDELPYDNGFGHTFDTGDFPEVLNRALDPAAWPESERRGASGGPGLLRGVGMGFWLAPTGGPSREYAALRFAEDGSVTLAVGSQSTGMGHETALTRLVAAWLGVPCAAIAYRQGDTDATPSGGGHSGSRTLGMAGSALRVVSDRVIEKAAPVAAHLLEAAAADVRFAEGAFVVAGTDRRIAMTDVIRASFDPSRCPDGFEGPLDDEGIYERPRVSYPNGCHVAEVEVDPDTGAVAVVGYRAVEDAGPVVDPTMAEGQIMGGVAQGVGQAVMEGVAYEPGGGQLLTGSLMDYRLPRADDLPDMRIRFFEDAPSTNNLLGIKGVGEAGCVGAPPAVVNAVLDALRPCGVRGLDMPLTSEKVWRAVRAAQAPA